MASLASVDVVYYSGIETSTDVNGNESYSTTHKAGFNIQTPSNSTEQPSDPSAENIHRENSHPEHITDWQVKSCNQCFLCILFLAILSFLTCKSNCL